MSDPPKDMGISERLEWRLVRLESLFESLIAQMGKAAEEEEALTIKEAAKMLKVSKSTVEKWLREDKLGRIKMGEKCIRLRKAEIMAVIRDEKVIET